MRRIVFVSLLLIGCGEKPIAVIVDAGYDGIPECDDIIAACHSVDPGSGDIHECHENAESVWHGLECANNKGRCVTLCTQVAADAGHADAGRSDAGLSDGGR